MAPRTRVDLHRSSSTGPNPLRVVECVLITLDHVQRRSALQIGDGSFQQRGLAGARRANEVEGQDLAAGQPRAVACRQLIVLLKNRLLNRHRAAVHPGVHVCGTAVVAMNVSAMRVDMVVIIVVTMMVVIVAVVIPAAMPVPLRPGYGGVHFAMQRRFLARLEIDDPGRRSIGASASSAHQTTPISISLMLSSSPATRSRSRDPQTQRPTRE